MKLKFLAYTIFIIINNIYLFIIIFIIYNIPFLILGSAISLYYSLCIIRFENSDRTYFFHWLDQSTILLQSLLVALCSIKGAK